MRLIGLSPLDKHGNAKGEPVRQSQPWALKLFCAGSDSDLWVAHHYSNRPVPEVGKLRRWLICRAGEEGNRPARGSETAVLCMQGSKMGGICVLLSSLFETGS